MLKDMSLYLGNDQNKKNKEYLKMKEKLLGNMTGPNNRKHL